MRVRTFRGKNMAEALTQVKREFGRDAVILNTRTLTRGGLFGFGGRGYVEITAARSMSDLPPAIRPTTLPKGKRRTNRAEGAVKRVSPATEAISTSTSAALLSELGALKTVVADLVRQNCGARVPEELYETYRLLVQNQVAEKLAQQLINQVRQALPPEQLRDASAVHAQLAAALETMLPMAGPIRIARMGEPTVIALVGPTGAGKTTTIAKLAANFRLRERRTVGLITIDTYRIAAVEQLRTYAQIIDVPLEVATSPRELSEAVGRMADRDVILIDTAGRSQRDELKIKELQGFFGAVTPHEVHLVISGTAAHGVITETIDRFGELGIDRVILTKLDEAVGFGVILTCLEQAQAKLSYVTTGQDVPDDISVGEGKALAKLILASQPPQRVSPAGAAGRDREPRP